MSLHRRCCCGGVGDCCKANSGCFGSSPIVNSLNLIYFYVGGSGVDLSAFGLSSTGRVRFNTSDTYEYVVPGASMGLSPTGCGTAVTAWTRLYDVSNPVNCWVRVTVEYTSGRIFKFTLEFAGASDGSGTIVSINASRGNPGRYTSSGWPLVPVFMVGLVDTQPASNTVTWSNSATGSARVTNSTTCCFNSETGLCQTGSTQSDALGAQCCATRFCTATGCTTSPEYLADKVIRLSDVGSMYQFEDQNHILVSGGTEYCSVPAGKTLLTPGTQLTPTQCLAYYKCTGEGGTVAQARSLVVPSSLALVEYGAIFSGADGNTTACPDVNAVPNNPILHWYGDGAWLNNYNHNEFWESAPESSYYMPDLHGWCGISFYLTFSSQCAYYDYQWDEELEDYVEVLVDAEHYYDLTIYVGGGPTWWVTYRAPFDPDPKRPDEVTFTPHSSGGSVPPGATWASTLTLEALW